MTHFGTTQSTASWLLGKPGTLDALHGLLFGVDSPVTLLADRELVEGPIRLSGTQDPPLICAWNVDSVTGLGDDCWGFINIGDSYGLAARPDIAREVLERCLYIISQRLQNLLIDGAFIHRTFQNGSHTCLAGRGTEARQVSVAYVERDVPDQSTVLRSVLCCGPEFNLSKLSAAISRNGHNLNELLPAARRLYDPARKKSVLGPQIYPAFRQALTAYLQPLAPPSEFAEVSVATVAHRTVDSGNHRTGGWNYRAWLAEDSPLSPIQRRLILSSALDKHPVRIVGPAGSGKTLLMQLLALRRLELAAKDGRTTRVLYLVHNTKMAETVTNRFMVLRQDQDDLLPSSQTISVRTLTDYGLEELSLSQSQIIDSDAYQAREFQLDTMKRVLLETLQDHGHQLPEKGVFRGIGRDHSLIEILARLVMEEVSGTIKGNGLTSDERRYVESAKPLSRLHGVLAPAERKVVFAAFRRYHRIVFDDYGVLDADDVAISLLGKLRTPIWELRRRDIGFDHVFIDEAQLFNENERRVLPLLTKTTTPYVPIVLALDEAQQLYGHASAGLATLGIGDMAVESLSSIHRSSRAIIRLAFFIGSLAEFVGDTAPMRVAGHNG